MRTSFEIAIIALVALFLTDAVRAQPQVTLTPSDGWRTLSAAEIEGLMGHKLGGLNQFGQPFLVEFISGGHSIIAQGQTWQQGFENRISDTGAWWPDGNRICFKMEHWFALQQHVICWKGVETNGIHYRFADRKPLYFDSVPWWGGTFVWQ